MNKLRVVGDVCHISSVVVFYAIARCRGNAAGVSLKAQELYLLVFVMRYIDLLTTFHSGYNTCMKLMFIFMTGLTVYTLKYIEPAKSSYSAAQDSYKHWSLVISTGIFAMLIHLLGSGVVDVKGGSGEEFEVHFEKYEMFSFLWTFSICLEPFAMLPQLYIFWKNRHLNPEIRFAMFLKGSYRLFYIANWVHRGQNYENYQHHVLIYLAGGLQVLMYADFFLYPVFAVILATGHRILKRSGDSMEDNEIETMALTDDVEEEQGWSPGDAPGPKVSKMRKKGARLGIV